MVHQKTISSAKPRFEACQEEVLQKEVLMTTPNLCTDAILLADDGSEHSKAAVKLLKDLRLDDQSKIMALRVFTPSDTSRVWLLERALKETEEALKEQGKQVESELVLGHPAEEIIEVAQKKKANLILIGAKGLRATLGILLGGVVQQVVEHADRPVMVVRAPYSGLKRVLLVVDGSEESKAMLNCIKTFPLPAEANFEVLHVAPPIPSEEQIIQYWPSGLDLAYAIPVEEIRVEAKKRAKEEEHFGEKTLNDALETLKQSNLSAKSTLLRGDAATKIIEYAKKNKTDLIVCGGKGLGPVQSWLLGSVSRKLLHYAPCSVMVVKGNKE